MVAENGGVQSDEEVPSRMNPLQLLNALRAGDTSRVQVEMNKNGAKGIKVLKPEPFIEP